MSKRLNSTRRQVGTALLALVANTALPTLAATPGANDFERILSRMRFKYLEVLPTGDAVKALSALSTDGEWADIDYADRSVGNWRPVKHLERLRALAVASRKPGQALQDSSTAREAIARGLRAWLRRSPRSDNWWQETIGAQLVLMPILALVGDQLPSDLLKDCLAQLHAPSSMPKAQTTGQNLVWYATEQLTRGVLSKSTQDLAAVQQALSGLLVVTEEEGIQADMSFHQHGPQLYSGGYGLGFLMDMAELAGWLADTPWQLSADSLKLLADYAAIGIGSIVRGEWLDWSARGREFTRHESMPRFKYLAASIRGLRELSPPQQRVALDALLVRMKPSGQVDKVVPYSRSFWRSDFVAHQTPAGYISVKMCSAETVGTEAGNGENLLGYWLPFGSTYFVRQGNEYDGLTPVMDWSSIPGVTCPKDVPPLQGYQRHKDGFAACVSGGQGAVAGLQLNILQTRARKAWFLLGDTMVALGAGIESSHAAPVRTTVNQTRWQGELWLDGASTRFWGERAGLRSANLNGIRYQALDDTRLQCVTEDVRASVDRSNVSLGATGPVSASVVTLRIDHGRQPRSARYAYATTFTGLAKQTDESTVPATVLANTSALQAVRWADGRHTMAVFHAAGELSLGTGSTLQVSHPCVAVLSGVGGQALELSLSCLDASGPALTVVLRNGARANTATFRSEQTRAKAPVTMSLRT